MRYEVEKLRVTLVSGETKRMRTFFFFFLYFSCFKPVFIYQPKYGILSGIAETIQYGLVFKLE